ncbi:MAG: type II toxin-antitoxin system VapC family toxin [Anaerolineae bacterium]|nr:type II toxin-antitoxin system VapC family toxin [Anaerolineae bacterium]
MIYLPDTHYVLWSLFKPDEIADTVRQILENDTDTKLISGISLWEISLKYALGKLELGGTDPSEILDILFESGFSVAELESHLLATYHNLPRKNDHRDPFDRLLIWQAITSGYTLITHDKAIDQYRADGLQLLLS